MKRIFSFIAMGVLVVLLLASGCTQSQPQAPQTTVATTVPPTMVTTPPPTTVPVATTAPPVTLPAVSLTPGPVETLPAIYVVETQVNRNSVSTSPDIIITFRGGKGINFVSTVQAKVTRSDGVVKTGELKKPKMDDLLTIEGTNGDDRVEVTVVLVDGKSYKVYDQLLPFRSYH